MEGELLERKPEMLKGIQFVVNDRGEKTAVQIDLTQYGELWEDIYDLLIAQERADEPRETLDEVRKRLLNQGKLND
jgi:hypothetical protein